MDVWCFGKHTSLSRWQSGFDPRHIRHEHTDYNPIGLFGNRRTSLVVFCPDKIWILWIMDRPSMASSLDTIADRLNAKINAGIAQW